MKSYRELIENNHSNFRRKNLKFGTWLLFNDVPLMDIINKYGTPWNLRTCPRIGENIRFVQATFQAALERV